MNDKCSDLYKRSNYLNKNIDYIKNVEIVEYDLKSGGLNIIKYFNILPESDIEYLEKLDNKVSQKKVGVMQKNNRDLSKALNTGFEQARRIFFEENNIQDDNVLSIKKDAIYLINTSIKHNKFKNLEFRIKNIYSSYYYIDKKEFYFNNKNNVLDIKGINDNMLKLHEDYILLELKKIFRLIENNELDFAIKRVIKLSIKYKNKELPIGFYRELNNDSIFRYSKEITRSSIGVDNLEQKDIDLIDIKYNILHIILPIRHFLIY